MSFRVHFITAFISLFCYYASLSYSYQCPGNEGASLPNAPVFPSNNMPANEYPSLGNGVEVIKDHWSEIVNPFRPSPVVPVANPPQTHCPHEQPNLLNWHDAATWPGNAVPSAGNDVTLPANSKVLISSCSVNPGHVYGIITIPATSELIFNDRVDISIRAKGFRVLGKLSAGSESCRLRNKVTITLHGKRSDQTLPTDSWVKGIYAEYGGVVDLHGVQYFPTWTRLALSGKVGDSHIFIQDIVNWEVGQTILITTTELKDSRDFNRNEIRTITAITRAPNFGDNISRITLNQPLSYRHYSGKEYQAEVALLSRRIKVQGDETDSEPVDYTNPAAIVCKDEDSDSTYPCQTESLHSGFGGHIQIAGTGSIGRASGIELFRMGQTNVVGRYPYHFHLIGSSPDSFIQDSSIHRSFFRCIAVHGTNDVRVSQNVAYDAIGHCYYLEDGVEENNLFEYNLGAHIHFIGPAHLTSKGQFGSWWSQDGPWLDESPTQVLPADISASPFYITSSYNSFIGNAASGGWSGFAFPNLPKAVKLFKSETATVSARPLKKFQGNSAHSTGYWFGSAGGIYVGGTLKHKTNSDTLTYTFGRDGARDTCLNDPKDTYGWCTVENYSWMVFEDTKIFLTNGRGFQHWGSRAEVYRLEVHDAGLSGNYFGDVYITDMLINCRSNHKPTFFSGCPVNAQYNNCNVRDREFWRTFGGFQWYDVGQSHIITDSIFRNCNANWNGPCIWQCSGVAPWIFLTHSDWFVPEVMQATQNIKYENVDPNNLFRFSTSKTDLEGITVSGRLQSWFDKDGSAAMATTTGRTMMGSDWAGNSWWRLNNNCEHREELYICPMAQADSSASITISHNPSQESQIGGTICVNGYHKGAYLCPVVGKVTHFGRTIDEGMDIGVNARITGPIIASNAGGWFVRFNSGTPVVLELKKFQVSRSQTLLLAFPYPSTTQFTIEAKTASWCWTLCTYAFTQTNSVSNVLNGDGTLYYFDSSKGLLYIRAVQQPDDSLGKNGVWTLGPLNSFSRQGIHLPKVGSQYRIVITASNCNASGGYCAQPSIMVPPAVNLSSPPPTSTPTYKPTTRSPSRRPSTMKPTYSPIQTNPQLSPTTMKPTTSKPTTLKPTTTSPTTSKPTTTSPTTSKPTTNSPTTSKPTTNSPTTPKPTTLKPTSAPNQSQSTLSPTTNSPTTSTGATHTPTRKPKPTKKPKTRKPTKSPRTRKPTSVPTTKPTKATSA